MIEILKQISLTLTIISSLLSQSPKILGAIELIVPESKIREVRGIAYTQKEYNILVNQEGSKVTNFAKEATTTTEELATIFDILNQDCTNKSINSSILTNKNTNNFIGNLLTNGC